MSFKKKNEKNYIPSISAHHNAIVQISLPELN